jgi:hypothetical protein
MQPAAAAPQQGYPTSKAQTPSESSRPLVSSSLQQHLPPTGASAPPSAEVSFALLSTITLGLAGALSLALPDTCSAQEAHASLATIQPQFDLAGDQDLLTNIARYGRYFVTVMLGTGYVMLRPLAGAFKNPLSGILATVGLVGGAVLLKFTLELMLGVTDAGV